MAHFQLFVLFGLGLITLINGQCVVNFQNGTVSNNGSACSSFSPSTLNNILNCSAIQLSDWSQGNVNNLKAFTDSAFDLYTLLRSKLDVGLVASSINSLRSNGSIVATLSDAGFARLWFQVKLSPYLSSLSRDTLSCLSQSNLTCQSFQALWQTALDKLTPEQKAELFFQLEASSSLNNDGVDQIFMSFLKPLTNIKLNMTRVTSTDSDKSLTDFLPLLRPLVRFINASAIIVQTTNSINFRNTTISLLVNWTNRIALSLSQSPISTINIGNVSDWLQTVVIPLTKTYLQPDQNLPDNITAMLGFIFAPEPQTPDPVEVCKVTSNNSSCLISQSGESLAKAINCVAQSNLSFTEENLRLLTAALQTQIEQSVKNSSQSNLTALFAELPAESFTSGNLEDVEFMRFWFQIKMKPLLPSVSKEFLSCLRTRNFSCQAYKALFVELNNNSGLMDGVRQRWILNDFIVPFLSQRQSTGVDCTLPFINSSDFVLQNFGNYFPLAQLQVISNLSRSFSAVDVLPFLSLAQLDELVFSPAFAANRTNILTSVFDFLLKTAPKDTVNSFLRSLQTQARKTNFTCANYRTIFDKVDQVLSSVPSNQSEALLTIRDFVMTIPPDECIERASQCTTTPVNESLCASVNSSALDQLLRASANATGPLNLCSFTMLEFACVPTVSQLTSQQLADVLACKQPSNVGKETWKLFFSKTSTILDDALLKFSNMTPSPSNVSWSDVLDVLVDVRVDRFSPQRLKDPAFIRSWFQGRLKPFLPSVSQRVLSCLSQKNLTCESYRVIFVELNNNSGLMDGARQRWILNDFIVPFLSQRQSTGVDCTLPFINSSDFVLQNFGNYFPLAQLQVISNLSRSFSAVDVLPLLTLVQLDELVFSPAFAANRTNILTSVFDFLLKTAPKDTVNSFLRSLQTQARKTNFTCANYRTIFDKVDQVLSSVPSNQSEALLTIRDFVMTIPPDECIERASQCTTTPVNESLCASVNSSALDQLLRASANATGPLNLCSFTMLEFACVPTVSQLTSQQLADVLACKQPSNVGKETWKLFFSKTSTILDDALLKFSNMTPSPTNVSWSDVLDVLVDVRVDRFSPQRLKDPAFIRSWFQGRLKPFLPSVSQRVLSCLSQKNLTCESYRVITEAFVNAPLRDGQDVCLPLQPNATQRQDLIYTEFMKAFLSRNDTEDPRCLRNTTNSTQWMNRNFGPFVQSAPLTDLVALNKNFTAVDVLPLLGLKQLVEFSASPGALTDPGNVSNVMQFVKDCQLPAFFDLFSQRLQVNLTQDVKAALIKQIIDRVNLSNLTIPDQEVVVWLNSRINPLLANLSESLVSPLFSILSTRNCNITQIALRLLDPVRSSISTNTKNAIYNGILQSFRVPQPLRCYRNNSFITFLNESLSGFGPLPNLTIFLSLMPQPRRSELVNSISPAELGSYFTEPKVVNNDSQICVIFNNFNRTPDFLENVEVPDDVKSTILPCVWPLALKTDNQTEVDLWFDRRLRLYLKFLNKDLIGSKETLSASCLSYRKMVNVLGNNFTFNGSQISSGDVYTTIKTYLKADTVPKCYSSSDPSLNSTAWFVNNIGMFITFMSLDDLYSFGSETTIQLFTVNPENIRLFGQKTIQRNVLNRYTELLFRQNINFNLFE
ncbi:uncharacterized protein [Chanodichthys erythropterus]|uniref:uncharacterized protein n=1 Tax=Chanodichthys erythropterus TaxID=933992 RepID=UPI00351E4524